MPLAPNGKPRYSDLAREEGWVDLELIETIEREIVEHGVSVSWESIADLHEAKSLLQEVRGGGRLSLCLSVCRISDDRSQATNHADAPSLAQPNLI